MGLDVWSWRQLLQLLAKSFCVSLPFIQDFTGRNGCQLRNAWCTMKCSHDFIRDNIVSKAGGVIPSWPKRWPRPINLNLLTTLPPPCHHPRSWPTFPSNPNERNASTANGTLATSSQSRAEIVPNFGSQRAPYSEIVEPEFDHILDCDRRS